MMPPLPMKPLRAPAAPGASAGHPAGPPPAIHKEGRLTGVVPLLALLLVVSLLVLGLLIHALAQVVIAVGVGIAVYLMVCYGMVVATLHQAGQPLPRRLWRAVLCEFGACYLMAFLWPVGLLLRGTRALERHHVERVPNSDPKEPAEPSLADDQPAVEAPLPVRRPVLLLHGYGMNSMTWVWLGGALRRLGLGPLYTATYFSPQSVEVSAAHLGRVVDEVLRRERAAKVDIIAHSLGGIVSRYYIERLGGKVANLATLGTPHQGTVLSRFGLGPVAAQLGRGATLLEQPVRPPDGVRYLSIYSTADQMVIPSDSARIRVDDEPEDERRRELRLDGLGHLSLLISPQVARLTAAALRLQEEERASEGAPG